MIFLGDVEGMLVVRPWYVLVANHFASSLQITVTHSKFIPELRSRTCLTLFRF